LTTSGQMKQRSGSTSRGDDPRAAVDAPLCAGKVSASWQVEGSSFRVELSNYLEASYTLEDRGTDRDRRGGSGSRTRRPSWPKADWTKSPVNALFRASESVRAAAPLYELGVLWEAQTRPRAIRYCRRPLACRSAGRSCGYIGTVSIPLYALRESLARRGVNSLPCCSEQVE